MVVAKCSFFFEQGKYGWSETWYRTDADLQESLEHAIRLGGIRAGLLGAIHHIGVAIDGSSPSLAAIRVSDVAIQRDSLMYQEPAGGLYGAWPGEDVYEADHPEVALMVRVESGSNYRRTLWLRGIPDRLWRGQGYKADALWLSRFAALRTELGQRQWQIRVVNKLNLPVQVTDMTKPINPGPINVAYEPGAGFISGSIVRLSGVRNAKQLNREWRVVVLSGIQAILLGSNNLALPAPYLGGATIKVQQTVYTPISNITVRGIRTREAGVPFDSPVGGHPVRQLTSL